jgi:hypothetical protein
MGVASSGRKNAAQLLNLTQQSAKGGWQKAAGTGAAGAEAGGRKLVARGGARNGWQQPTSSF